MELSVEEKQKIIDALPKVKNRIFPDGEALELLSDIFKREVDSNFSLTCNRCKRNLTSYWSSQITEWNKES